MSSSEEAQDKEQLYPSPCGYFPDRTAYGEAYALFSRQDAYEFYRVNSAKDKNPSRTAEHCQLNLFEELLLQGFRRSGDVIYKEVCPDCKKCVPIRITVADFSLSKSQRHLLRKNSAVQVTVTANPADFFTEEKVVLMQKYDKRHAPDKTETLSEVRDMLKQMNGIVSKASDDSAPVYEKQYAGTLNMCYKPRIDFELLQKYHEGIICLSACIQGELPKTLLYGTEEKAEALAKKYAELFGKDHYYIELQDHGIAEQKEVAPKLIALARKLDIPLVVTNDIHYCRQEDAAAQDILVCIGTKKLRKDPNRMKFQGDQWYMKTEEEMRRLFPQCPDAIDNTLKIASMCNLTIPQYKTEQLKECLPVYQIPKEYTSQDAFVLHLVETGLRKRYKEITKEILDRAMYELGIIYKMGFSGYFLIVWEFINWSKEHGIPIGPGRGSGAGSLVAYAMTITDIDPFRFKLIFERFLNPERVSMPDFDVDMDFEFRQNIIQHTREWYGDPQVGHIVTFGTLKAKAVIADVGRVLDIPLNEVNMLKKFIPENPKARLKDAFTPPDADHADNGQLIPYKDDPKYKELFDMDNSIFSAELSSHSVHRTCHSAGSAQTKLPRLAA